MKNSSLLSLECSEPYGSIQSRALAVFAGLLVCLVPALVQATPYASGLTNSDGTIYFFLNESADNVKVIFDGGAGGLNDLGSLPAGRHSFSLGTHAAYQIVVTKSSGPGYLLGVTNRISAPSNVRTWFYIPRGVAVNRNAASPYFGRVYVSESQGGTTTVPGTRTTTDGIYLLNPDLTDAVGQGDTARTAGIAFVLTPQNSNTPWKIEVGEDDSLYIADWTTNHATIWVTDPNVITGTNVLEGLGTNNPTVHTTISSSPVTTGSLTNASLTVWAIDGRWPSSRNRLLRWDVGAGPLPYNSPPAVLGSAGNSASSDVYCDVDRGPDGKLYVLQNRSNGTDTDSLRVFDETGTNLLWGSLARTGSPDTLRQIRAVKVSPNGQLIALNRDDGRTWIIGLTNGIPDMSKTNLIDTFVSGTSSGRDVAFDAAGNLYTINNNIEELRVYSPGGTTIATTGSDGTFTVTVPPPVSVTVLDDLASEAGPDPAAFRIVRGGDIGGELTVYYTLTGTATNGFDYETNTLSATIPVGETNVDVTITPIDDSTPELLETVVITLVATPDYNISAPVSGSAVIMDNEQPMITLVASDTNMYERIPEDAARFTVTRYGDTNGELFVNYILGGTAAPMFDYAEPVSQLWILPGEITGDLIVSPYEDYDLEGDETVIITLAPASFGEYTVGASDSAVARLQDDELPPAPDLFLDDFDYDTSANWQVLFGANNGIYDVTNFFAFDYGTLGIPAAPHSVGGSTRGLFVAVNKTDSTAGGSAGINFYPIGQSFHGDYALRFDMFLSYGASFSTEHALAGINHSGLRTNRVTQSADVNNTTAGADGIWMAIETDGSPNIEYGAYTGTSPTSLPTLITNRPASALAGLLTSPPWSAVGSPGMSSTSTNRLWADVELRQAANWVTLKVNDNVVYSFTNTSDYTRGNVMLGHNDQFDSIGQSFNYVIFDNVRVVSLAIRITAIQVLDNDTIQIDFESVPGGPASDYILQSAGSLNPPVQWHDEPGAAITQVSSGYRAVTPLNSARRYFRIRR